MPEEAVTMHDKALIANRRFDKQRREELKKLVTPEILEEHRRDPSGVRHSDALMRLLVHFRSASIVDKYALRVDEPFKRYRLIALSGLRGVPPRLVDDRVYPSLPEAFHAVFLKRCQDLLES